MAFHFSPKVVTDGLVLYLDAANYLSYVSGSTAWNDLTENGNNGTLINGPNFDSANVGSIVFDGVNDYLDCGNSTSILSITDKATWGGFVRFSNLGNFKRFIFKDDGSKVVLEIFFHFTLNAFIGLIFTDTGRTSCIGATQPILNQIYYLMATYDGSNIRLYVNGVLDGIVNKTGIIPMGPGGGLFIANSPLRPTNDFWLNGNVYNVQIYNRTLSAQEVLQNYNALKGRYGL